MTTTGLRNPGPEPIGAGRSAHKPRPAKSPFGSLENPACRCCNKIVVLVANLIHGPIDGVRDFVWCVACHVLAERGAEHFATRPLRSTSKPVYLLQDIIRDRNRCFHTSRITSPVAVGHELRFATSRWPKRKNPTNGHGSGDPGVRQALSLSLPTRQPERLSYALRRGAEAHLVLAPFVALGKVTQEIKVASARVQARSNG